MKKLTALALGIALFSRLNGFTIGAGIAGYDVVREGRSFSLLADASLPILPTVFWRAGIFNLNFRPDPQGMNVRLSTGLASDLLAFVPVDMPITPYLVAGLNVNYYSYDNAGVDLSGTDLGLKIGLGGQSDIGPVFGYLELGTDFSLSQSGGGSHTEFPVFVQLGIRKPLKFKIKR